MFQNARPFLFRFELMGFICVFNRDNDLENDGAATCSYLASLVKNRALQFLYILTRVLGFREIRKMYWWFAGFL